MKKNSSFEFYSNYEERVMKLQPDIYIETRRIIDEHLLSFNIKNNRKAKILDIGGGGLIVFNPELSSEITILDLFQKPNKIVLPNNAIWTVGNILDNEIRNEKYDLILLSSVIHHLADKNNNIIRNLRICFNKCAELLNKNGNLYIFDGTCPALLSKLQDVFYPFYTFLLLKIIKFTYVRILSLSEIKKCLEEENLDYKLEFFKQPKWIGQIYWRVPARFYPLRFSCIRVYKKEQ